MDTQAFVKVVREAAAAIDQTGPEGIAPHVQKVREALAQRGLGGNCHLDKGGNLTPVQEAEWYAGQLIDIADSKAWFAMNSWLNCVDKFCPAGLQ